MKIRKIQKMLLKEVKIKSNLSRIESVVKENKLQR